jgi:hypothetical protein
MLLDTKHSTYHSLEPELRGVPLRTYLHTPDSNPHDCFIFFTWLLSSLGFLMFGPKFCRWNGNVNHYDHESFRLDSPLRAYGFIPGCGVPTTKRSCLKVK